jgi:beta-lysine 5,6-aminomutase alpha subunit
MSTGPSRNKLGLPPESVERARALATSIVAPVQTFIDAHTSVTVERATLRLLGADGASVDGIPVPNLVVDQIRASSGGLDGGAAAWFVSALLRSAPSN